MIGRIKGVVLQILWPWTLKRRITEHKQVVKFDDKNNIAVQVHKHDHRIDWEGASIVTLEQSYWRRRVREAIHTVLHHHHEPWLWFEA